MMILSIRGAVVGLVVMLGVPLLPMQASSLYTSNEMDLGKTFTWVKGGGEYNTWPHPGGHTGIRFAVWKGDRVTIDVTNLTITDAQNRYVEFQFTQDETSFFVIESSLQNGHRDCYWGVEDYSIGQSNLSCWVVVAGDTVAWVDTGSIGSGISRFSIRVSVSKTNYSLPDLSANISSLRSDITNLVANVSALSDTVAALEQRLVTVEDVQRLSTQINDTMASLEYNLTLLEQLNTTLATQNGSLSLLTDQLVAISVRVSDLQRYVLLLNSTTIPGNNTQPNIDTTNLTRRLQIIEAKLNQSSQSVNMSIQIDALRKENADLRSDLNNVSNKPAYYNVTSVRLDSEGHYQAWWGMVFGGIGTILGFIGAGIGLAAWPRKQ